jgi:hypothetical protein
MILKLEELEREHRLHFTDIRHVWVQSDAISHWEPIRSPEGHAPGSVIWLRDGGNIFVYVDPDELARLIDPENACPEPAHCSYTNHYLVYGPADLTHGGWHAAERLGRQHFAECRKSTETGICGTCSEWERRLRA